MLTVVIETRNDEDALASTLGSLVSAAVEGVVREVLVHDRGSTDRTAAVIDHTGCTLVREGALASSLARARGDWILVLEPGARLLDGWMRLRDRRGPLAALVLFAAYLLIVLSAGLVIAHHLGFGRGPAITPLTETLLLINAASLAWRALWRGVFTERLMGVPLDGDGLVRAGSARGRGFGTPPPGVLPPKAEFRVFSRTSHMGLMTDPQVREQVRTWLGEPH